MTIEHRHYTDQLILSLQRRESAYNVAVDTWDDTTATTMAEFPDTTAHEAWDDQVVGESFIRQGKTVADQQAIARQSVRIAYAEPRTKPHTLAGLMALSLGGIASLQQRWLTAYRHALMLAAPLAVPSISAMTGHQRNHYVVYAGLKSEGFTLSIQQQNPYLDFTCQLVGAGSRVPIATPGSFPSAIAEPWLRIGDCRVYLADVTDTPLLLASTPTQGSTNLSGSVLALSSRIIACSIAQQNMMNTAGAYRVSTGLQRSNCYAAEQPLHIQLLLEVDTATEATELAWYLNQRHLAFELQCVHETVIDPVTITNVTVGTPPTHHIVLDSNSTSWYLSVNLLGELVLDSSPPAGTGLNVGTGIIMRALDGWRYRIGASPLQEVTTEQTTNPGISPHVVELCAILDSNGDPWYLWNDGLGEIAVSRAPVPIVPYQYGVTLICPRVQWKAIVRQQQNQSDVLQMTGTVLDDGVLGAVYGFVYNKISQYLA